MWAAGHPPILNRLPSFAPYTTSSDRATTVPAATKSTVHPPTCAVAPCSSLQTPPPITPSQAHDPTGRDYHPPTPPPPRWAPSLQLGERCRPKRKRDALADRALLTDTYAGRSISK